MYLFIQTKVKIKKCTAHTQDIIIDDDKLTPSELTTDRVYILPLAICPPALS